MKLIFWPTVEFDNETKIKKQYLHDKWNCTVPVNFIALLKEGQSGQ